MHSTQHPSNTKWERSLGGMQVEWGHSSDNIFLDHKNLNSLKVN
jgi:hypothetical protein